MSIRIKFSQYELRDRAATILGLDRVQILNVCPTFGGEKYLVLVLTRYGTQGIKELTICQIVSSLPIKEHNVSRDIFACSQDLTPVLLTLGLDCFPDKKALKAAYRELCKTLHPDAGGDATNFIELQRSYELVLARIPN